MLALEKQVEIVEKYMEIKLNRRSYFLEDEDFIELIINQVHLIKVDKLADTLFKFKAYHPLDITKENQLLYKFEKKLKERMETNHITLKPLLTEYFVRLMCYELFAFTLLLIYFHLPLNHFATASISVVSAASLAYLVNRMARREFFTKEYYLSIFVAILPIAIVSFNQTINFSYTGELDAYVMLLKLILFGLALCEFLVLTKTKGSMKKTVVGFLLISAMFQTTFKLGGILEDRLNLMLGKSQAYTGICTNVIYDNESDFYSAIIQDIEVKADIKNYNFEIGKLYEIRYGEKQKALYSVKEIKVE